MLYRVNLPRASSDPAMAKLLVGKTDYTHHYSMTLEQVIDSLPFLHTVDDKSYDNRLLVLMHPEQMFQHIGGVFSPARLNPDSGERLDYSVRMYFKAVARGVKMNPMINIVNVKNLVYVDMLETFFNAIPSNYRTAMFNDIYRMLRDDASSMVTRDFLRTFGLISHKFPDIKPYEVDYQEALFLPRKIAVEIGLDHTSIDQAYNGSLNLWHVKNAIIRNPSDDILAFLSMKYPGRGFRSSQVYLNEDWTYFVLCGVDYVT